MKLNLSARLSILKKAIVKYPYILLFIGITVAYLTFNLMINSFSEVLPFFLNFRLAFVIPYFTLTILIAFLIAANINLVVYKIRELRSLSFTKEGSMTAIGFFGGILGGACPGCFVGVLPILAASLGVNVALGSLPFKGFEIQIPTFLVLLATTYILTNPLTCKVKLN